MTVTYSSFLRLDELLSLQQHDSQGAGAPEHDELLFIIVHQVYELWFKQILHELDYLSRKLQDGDAPRSQHTLKRILTILKIMVAQLDILETMTPTEFLAFRDHLESGSGFDSYQFRELEFTLGYKRPGPLERYEQGSPEWQRLERDFTQPMFTSEEVQAVLIEIYRNDPAATVLCERFTDLDEGIQEWRYRHVKMVERTIGTKRGTGGSAGVEYLKTTLFKPLFPDLWAIRTEL